MHVKTTLKLLRSSKQEFAEDFDENGPADEKENKGGKRNVSSGRPEDIKKNKKKRGSKRRSLKKKMKKRKRSIEQCQTVCKDQSLSKVSSEFSLADRVANEKA